MLILCPGCGLQIFFPSGSLFSHPLNRVFQGACTLNFDEVQFINIFFTDREMPCLIFVEKSLILHLIVFVNLPKCNCAHLCGSISGFSIYPLIYVSIPSQYHTILIAVDN